MTTLTLKKHVANSTVLVENDFIDRLMPYANGEFVKVYLLILRHANKTPPLDVSAIADLLHLTEKDVRRALDYWMDMGLLDYSFDESERSTSNIQNIKSHKELRELLFIAEQYLGRTLSYTDTEIITYIYETLKMPAELIDYLIEYCVENNHKSIHYIRQVAISWHDSGISTVDDAKNETSLYARKYYPILKALCIRGREPADSEIVYMKEWLIKLELPLDIILEACKRTMSTIHTPSFDYTNTILETWHKHGVQSIEDILALDAAHEKDKHMKRQGKSKLSSGKNRFNNFEGRTYNMEELERQLLQ